MQIVLMLDMTHSKNRDIQTVPINEETAELIGAYIGDGHLEKSQKRCHYTFTLTGHKNADEDYLKNYLPRIIKKYFPRVNIKYTYRKRKNGMYLVINNKDLYTKLIHTFELRPGSKTKTIIIPAKIFEKNKQCINATIRGIFDTDGCFFLDKRKRYKRPYPRISLEITSNALFEQLKKYLANDFTLYTKSRKREGRSQSYILEIYGHTQLIKWIEEIGFSNHRHKDKVESIETAKTL